MVIWRRLSVIGTYLIIGITALVYLSVEAHAEILTSHDTPIHPKGSIACRDEKETGIQDTSQINKSRLITVLSGVSLVYMGSMAYLQYIWYKDHDRVSFHYYNDMGGYNQIDKFGHIYGSYLQSYIGLRSFLWAGVPGKKAVLYGGTLGFLMQLPIELWDGLYEGWGFSWSDIAANAMGSGIVIGQELLFQEQIIKFKFTFSPSPYARQANGYLGSGFDQLLYDYNGHTYWLSAGLNHVIPNQKIPGWLNIAFGYSAGGMFGEFKNKISYRGVMLPLTERYRQFLFSLDIDFTGIPTKNKTLKSIFNSMFMIKIPLPTLEINTKGEFKFHPLYY
jgi:hypothetical protein